MSADSSGGSNTAEDVRRAFGALPWDDKISTLIRIELDMVGDAVECVVSAASKTIDDIANACCDRSAPASSGESKASAT